MKFKNFTIAGIGLAILLGASVSHAQISLGTEGHLYEFVSSAATNWSDANAAASAAAAAAGIDDDYTSHLVTIDSDGENALVEMLFGPASTASLAWIGGYQLPEATNAADGWRWISNGGEIPPNDDFDSFADHWALAEPSNDLPENTLAGLADQDYLIFSIDNSSWYAANIYGASAALAGKSVSGYVVEYEPVPPAPPEVEEEVGVIIDPETCKGAGCNTIPEQRIILPASYEVPPGATIVYRAWYLDDPRVNAAGQCVGFDPDPTGNGTRGPLDVFEYFLPGEPELHGTLILQEYLCGSPRFAVVRTYAPEIKITEDTVEFKHQKLADNLFECDPSTLPPSDPGAVGIGNPQFRDTAVWRSTQHNALEEHYAINYGGIIGESWEGSASDRTVGCSSND